MCTLSYKIDATAETIIKYGLKPRTTVESAALSLLAIAVSGAYAVGALNLYYRVLVERLPTA